MKLFTVILTGIDKMEIEFNNEVVLEFYSDQQEFFNKVPANKIMELTSEIVQVLKQGDKNK